MSATRHTIAAPVSVEGVGLHLGQPCRLTFRPAPSGTGVLFRRTDVSVAADVPARAELAVLSDRRTQLGDGDAALHTVEHVLAAVAALEVDDVLIEMDGPEPPIVDGSALPYVEALLAAGLVNGAGAVEYLDITQPVHFEHAGACYDVMPAPSLTVDVTIEFPHPLIGTQHGRYRVTPETFRRELAPARTFGFVHEVEELRARGLIQGASTENALVLDERGVIDQTLHWPDEFVRHKAMDCIGDLALAGKRVRASIVAQRPSHRATVALVRKLLTLAAKETRMLAIEEVMKILPHRYPFLLVDRVLELEAGKRVVGIKNVTINEPFFQGHFPGHPIMPGVLIIEAMAQVGGTLLLGSVEDPENKVVYFMSLDNVKWRRPVKPGDQLRFEVEMVQIRGRICRMRGVGYVDGDVVAEADMAAMVRDR
ncbi:MAG TPA: bifunctional UDP-3-O-[3-hydroxymyristoyl] N-acetylglucosamine deacetylase/3-hydroxyacyl-ACP dehydratase [Gemmatimonadaceae bacterium]|nr:bifunctional UDP-3-O-[3-hydroxymyristoyl] N-acetylglucosamine deacetylase/3-hydroxyacyl-ACP dehydratase [Gemmatimonadaceae bacterium]